jgi:hypothetical protein
METGIKRKHSNCPPPSKTTKNSSTTNKYFSKTLKKPRSFSCVFKAKPMPRYPPAKTSSRSNSARLPSIRSLKSKLNLQSSSIPFFKARPTVDLTDSKSKSFKARPAPRVKSPFRPKVSSKKLTIPIDPVLHTDLRAHSRENHN